MNEKLHPTATKNPLSVNKFSFDKPKERKTIFDLPHQASLVETTSKMDNYLHFT